MSDLLEYKGYFGSLRFSDEDRVLHGKVEFIRDLVTFGGRDASSIKRAFREAVDDYLALCATLGRKPEVPPLGINATP
jgi:predicted HicB family RNase H-like nuclease